MFFEPDIFTGYRLKPGSTGHFQNGIPAVVNSHGHRDDEVTLAKGSGVFRILLLGDSFTVGANVSRDDAYPQVLERLLNEDSPLKVEVVNSGVGGWAPFQYAQYYQHYGRSFEPDMVVVGLFIGNDAYAPYSQVDQLMTAVMGRRVSREQKVSPFIRQKIFLYENTNIGRLILNKGYLVKNFIRNDCGEFPPKYIKTQRMKKSLHRKKTSESYTLASTTVHQVTRINSMVRADGAQLIVALLPDEKQVSRPLQEAIIDEEEWGLYDFDMPQAILKEMLSFAGIEVIDLLPEFLQDDRCLYMNDTHWTVEGHDLAATVLYKKLVNTIW